MPKYITDPNTGFVYGPGSVKSVGMHPPAWVPDPNKTTAENLKAKAASPLPPRNPKTKKGGKRRRRSTRRRR